MQLTVVPQNYLLQSQAEDDGDDDFTLSKKSIQTRVNQLTRELHKIERTAESTRYIEKKARLSGGPDSLLISSGLDSKPKAASGRNVQTDIHSFFVARPNKKPETASKTSNGEVLDLCGSDSEGVVSPKCRPSGDSDSHVEVYVPPLKPAGAKSLNAISSPKQDTVSKRKESPSGADAEADGSPQKKTKVV